MRALPLLALVVLAACEDNPFGLRATDSLFVDTVSLWAASDPRLEKHSAFFIGTNGAFTVRTDRGGAFDFAFDIDTADKALLLPTGAMDLGIGSGVHLSDQAFDSIKVAPGSRYQDTVAVVVDTGAVAVIRSRPTQCGYPGIFYSFYAKVRVLAVDLTDRRLDFAILANTNCGYTSLEPGLPRR